MALQNPELKKIDATISEMEVDVVEPCSSNKAVENNIESALNKIGDERSEEETEPIDLVMVQRAKEFTQNVFSNTESPGLQHSIVSADSSGCPPSITNKTCEKDEDSHNNSKYENQGNPDVDNNYNAASEKTVTSNSEEIRQPLSDHAIYNDCQKIVPKDTDDAGPNCVKNKGVSISDQGNYSTVKLYAEDVGPKLYPVKGNIVTPLIITKNLPEAFKFLPVFGMPKTTAELEEFQTMKTREYVGCDLSDDEFSKLAKFCSPDNLRTGNELTMSNRFPTQEPLPDHVVTALEARSDADNLCVVKKLKLRMDKDISQAYMKKLKYRGLKLLPLPQNEDYKISFSPLEPGKDLIFRVRVYRPFYCSGKLRNNTRHSVFSNDLVLLGRQKLTVLRDRLVCANDVGTRVDVSENPDEQPSTSAKDIFPSGFLFINNAFYVDTRAGCVDYAVHLQKWARKNHFGEFPRYDMTQVTVDQLLIKLGHPEVYVHQGNCQHLFTFSEVRLLGAADPLRQSVYPFATAASQNQTIYCTTCAEFGARWIVTGCEKVPFDPAFFCETCFKLYLYQDGRKVCDFKAYSYRGNEINLLKPVG